jgi:hypothetical protein
MVFSEGIDAVECEHANHEPKDSVLDAEKFTVEFMKVSEVVLHAVLLNVEFLRLAGRMEMS